MTRLFVAASRADVAVRLASFLLAVLAVACAEVVPIGPVPVVGEASDDLFLLVVRSPADRYAARQPIDVAAEIVYQGPKNAETIYHAESPIGWQIVQLDGSARMGGGMGQPCRSTDLRQGHARRYPFRKAGVADETGPFVRAWFEDRVLRLPPGRWRFVATLTVSLLDCGAPPHTLEASIDMTVLPVG